MLEDIESNENIEGVTFWEKILHSIRLEHIQENSFSDPLLLNVIFQMI